MTVALVTGAASGIGRATALVLARGGHHVILCDRDAAGLDGTAAAIVAAGGTAEPLALDLRDLTAVRAAAATILGRHDTLAAIVTAAGISGHGTPFEAVDEAAFEAMFDIHVKGHFFLLQGLVPALAGGGAVVIVSSMFALTGSPNMPHYTAAKGALLGLCRGLAVELGPRGIRVNAVAPGLDRTPMTERSAGDDPDFFTRREAAILLRRLATPEDVAATCAFLASPAAASLTGQTLSPSGGEAFTG